MNACGPIEEENAGDPAHGLPGALQASAAPSRLRLEIQPQPDDITCGPTCLHAVYRYFGDSVSLEQVIAEVTQLSSGGTLAALLGAHALRRGYRARIYTFDLSIFDPTWLPGTSAQLIERLAAQAEIKCSAKHRTVSGAYRDFLRLGGTVRLEDLKRSLIRRYLNRRIPIIAGLSSTYLYRAMREIPETNADDDLRGEPSGHFVVLHGYDNESRAVSVADPYANHPFLGEHRYEAPIDRVVCSILLGVVTYDANLLIIEPPAARRKEQRAGSREQGAESREQRAGSREQGAESREQGAGSREQGAGSREQRAGSRERRAEMSE